MTSYGYIIMIIVDFCMIWFQFDCIMHFKNHIILLLMLVAEKVLLLLVISLIANTIINTQTDSTTQPQQHWLSTND